MYNKQTVRESLLAGQFDPNIQSVYGLEEGSSDIDALRDRLIRTVDGFDAHFGDNQSPQIGLFSAPGRTEIGGNHTDHQLGKVLAGSVNLDVVAAAAPNNTNTARVYSEGYGLIEVDLDQVNPLKEEEGTTAALIRGFSSRVKELGYPVSGFDAYVISSVPGGSGLSSSAAFETLIGNILNGLFLEGALNSVEIAKIGQYTENVFFGKPSGLMDQMASSVGGIVAIDFADPEKPVIEKIDFDFHDSGYALCIIDTHSDHADLTDEYAAIPDEMKQVASRFGKTVLREVDPEAFYQGIVGLREELDDRAVLRAMHFFNENARVDEEKEALKNQDFDAFLDALSRSGESSILALQNIWPIGAKEDMSVAFSIEAAKEILGRHGAVRVHGGGFAGTIQAFVPLDRVDRFKESLEAILGPGSCYVLSIRPVGGCAL